MEKRLSAFCLGLMFLLVIEVFNQQRACHKDGRIGTHNHTDKYSKGEVMNHASTKEVEAEHYQESSNRCNDSTAESLIDRFVDNFAVVFLAIESQVFTDAVKHHDGVVEGITHNGKKCCHHRKIDLVSQE